MALKTKPSARTHRRYLAIHAKNKHIVTQAMLDYLGILGWTKAQPLFVQHQKTEIILSVTTKEVSNVRAAFTVSPEKIHVTKVSGTLKGLRQ